jgi:hypothetical protein
MMASPTMKNLRQRRAYHESGHCVAAPTFAIPIISVTIADDHPHLHRGHYRAHEANFGIEAMVTLCLAGPEAEREFCGSITAGSDQKDYQMAREYLARCVANPLQAAAALARFRDAAQRLVRSAWARQRIRLLAAALLEHDTLTAEQISDLC